MKHEDRLNLYSLLSAAGLYADEVKECLDKIYKLLEDDRENKTDDAT